jgi:hypothetical protein
MPASYSEIRVRTHVVGVERIEKLRWRVSVDGRPLFTFCSEARAREAGRLEARRLDFAASDAAHRRAYPPMPVREGRRIDPGPPAPGGRTTTAPADEGSRSTPAHPRDEPWTR